MEPASNRFFYKINCELWADGLGNDSCSFLLTIPEFEEFKECAKELSWTAYLDEGQNIPVRMHIDSWTKKLVTKRYYKKYKSVLYNEGYASMIIWELEQEIEKTKKNQGGDANVHNTDGDDNEDGPYYQVDCRVNLGPNGITSTIMLTNIELLALKKNHDPTETAFSIGDWHEKTSVSIESWKEHVVLKKDYESLSKALHKRECEKRLLQAIERWVSADEKKELAAFIKANNIEQDESSDEEEEEDEDEDEDEDENGDEEGKKEDEGDNEDEESEEDDDEVEEKLLQKKVKKN